MNARVYLVWICQSWPHSYRKNLWNTLSTSQCVPLAEREEETQSTNGSRFGHESVEYQICGKYLLPRHFPSIPLQRRWHPPGKKAQRQRPTLWLFWLPLREKTEWNSIRCLSLKRINLWMQKWPRWRFIKHGKLTSSPTWFRETLGWFWQIWQSVTQIYEKIQFGNIKTASFLFSRDGNQAGVSCDRCTGLPVPCWFHVSTLPFSLVSNWNLLSSFLTKCPKEWRRSTEYNYQQKKNPKTFFLLVFMKV